MSMLKFAAAILIIAIGLVGAYMIVKTPNLPAGTGTESLTENINGGANAEEPSVKWLEKSGSFISDKLGDLNNLFASAKNTIIQSVDNPKDATQQVSSLIFNKLKSMDEQGENPFESLDLSNLDDPEVQKLIEEAISSVQNPLLLSTSTIDNSQLNISTDNSLATKVSYIEGIKKIINDKFSDPKYKRSPESLRSDINNDCFVGEENSLNRDFSVLYQDVVDDYEKLSIPSDWLEIHKKMIIYFKKANLVYRDLADCFNDPIRGYVAIWALPQLIEEGQQIQTSLDNLVKTL
jgi:hypothetical protein